MNQKHTAMKRNTSKTFFLLLFTVFSCSTALFAQLSTPQVSQLATVSQRVGITDITISYSRPKVNGRKLWGGIVPFGLTNLGFGTATAAPWRAGANENSTITFSHDVNFGGKEVKAGIYGLFVNVIDKDKASILLSSNSTSWGSYFYEASEIVASQDIKTRKTSHNELLTYSFPAVTASSTTVSLAWGEMDFQFMVTVPVVKIVTADIKDKLKNTQGFNRQSWEQAAQYALANDGDAKEALNWINNAIAGQFYSKTTFGNLSTKAQLLTKMGRASEASKVMEEAMPLASVLELHGYGRQLITIGNKDKALKVFQANAKANKGQWPVNYGLSRGYSALGNYKTALKYLKKAHENAPNARSKANVASNIEKLEKGEDIN